MKRNDTRRTLYSGFTLIELLTVIAIIGILAAILIPVVGHVREQAKRAKCASNLRQHGFAHNLYRDETSRYMDSMASSPGYPHWLSAAQRNELMYYGLEWEMFFCPSSDEWNAEYMLEVHRTTASSVVIGYAYFPGQRSMPGFESTVDPLPYDLIMVDIVRKWGGKWENGINHANGPGAPAGANHLRVDGSVEWIPADEFMDEGPYAVGGVQWYFKNPYQPEPVRR